MINANDVRTFLSAPTPTPYPPTTHRHRLVVYVLSMKLWYRQRWYSPRSNSGCGPNYLQIVCCIWTMSKWGIDGHKSNHNQCMIPNCVLTWMGNGNNKYLDQKAELYKQRMVCLPICIAGSVQQISPHHSEMQQMHKDTTMMYFNERDSNSVKGIRCTEVHRAKFRTLIINYISMDICHVIRHQYLFVNGGLNTRAW